MKVLVVGGGTAGLITALILKTRLNITVDIVKSDSIGIVGVGEGSTEHFTDFMKFVGITDEEIIKHCDATYKSGILFDNWTPWPYLHHVSEDFNLKAAQYKYVYANQISKKQSFIYPPNLNDNTLSTHYLNRSDVKPLNQYHFNTYKLNDFLSVKAKSLGIQIFTDDIQEVNLYETGYIKSVSSEKNLYEYDFFIDSTGFKKLLIGKLGAKWRSFNEYLKMKSAVVFQTEDTENYNIWTISRAMDYGWMFRLPVWGRYGNGYIFDSNYISVDQAKDEVLTFFKKQNNNISVDINFGKEFTFDAGALEKPWINNCVAVGLSSVFVEPMEASSIGTSIQQAFMLMHRLINYTDKSIDKYNADFTNIVNNTRDFVALHYITEKNNTNFWSDIREVSLPPSLKENLGMWRNKLPIREDFNSSSNYSLFFEDNFIVVMAGLGLFNTVAIKKEYEYLNKKLKLNAEEMVNRLDSIYKSLSYISHKEYLQTVRNY